MPNLLPTISGGHTAIAPLTRNVTWDTDVAIFEDGSEQRWINRSALDTFVLTYKNISRTDRDILNSFIATLKGSFDSTWTFAYLQERGQVPTNGNLTWGGKYWTIAQDSFQAFTQFYTSKFYSQQGETVAVAINNAITIPGSTTVSANWLSTAPFGYNYNQSLTLDVWLSGGGNNLFPSGVSAFIQPKIFVTSATGAFLGYVDGPVVQLPSGWRPDSATLPPNPFTASANGAAVMIIWMINNTTNPIPVPVNTMSWAWNGYRVFTAGEVGVYPSCAFEDDAFTWTEDGQFPGRFSGSVRFRQTKVGGQRGAGSLTFPGLGPDNARGTGYPYITTDNYYVVRNDMPTGRRVAYTFTGSPTSASRPMRSWTLTCTTLNNLDLAKIEQHFLACKGSYRLFGFTDQDSGKFYPRVRYDMDTLEITNLQPNLSSVSLKLREVYGTGWVS